VTYSTKTKAVAALEAKGFTFSRPAMMGAAGWRKGSAYAWITEDWSRQHRAMRFWTHIAGA
jgi:hypothetical protein